MEITNEILDITAYEKEKLKPATLVDRGDHMWLTRDLPVGFPEQKGETEWGIATSGEKVRILLHPYLVYDLEPTSAMLYAVNLALTAYSDVSVFYNVDRMHVSIGHPVHEHTNQDNEQVLRFWIGFGFQVKAKK